MDDEDEVQRAMKFLKEAANGHKFFGAKRALFNPQLIQEFLDAHVNTHTLSHSGTK